ncbi:hypothetical protein IE81DRAFT_113344 [Ceraceosorus guamensis]|uniref:Fungal-type protein kinase domain-containing protein n=1 Tax=Ceraceosorus guamensis TaxID=1522189 RepID=A0A316VZ05_9BASI|nr:hypothetical protein IE81DRAFT_113344 [Ceraceosorus guamensis]PWN42740.1 hypothetical protein IE81DRAFT_113344 [Ceraceosorus guamensis]
MPAHMHPWLQYVGVIEVKRLTKSDLDSEMVGQMLRYARQLLIAHPFARWVHVVSWTGLKVRLWQFNANGVVLSRALEVGDKSVSSELELDELGKLLHLLLSGEETILPRWTPVKSQKILQDAARKARLSPDHILRSRIVNVRPALNGSRTVVFGAEISDDCSGSSHEHRGKFVFVKCSWLPERLADHEHQILTELSGASGAPLPLVSFELGWTTSTSYTISDQKPPAGKKPASKGRVAAYAVVFLQHRGDQIPRSLKISDMSRIFRQLSEQLLAYARLGFTTEISTQEISS